MEPTLYDLAGLIGGHHTFDTDAQLQFTGLNEFGDTTSVARHRSFADMLGLVIDEMRLPGLTLKGTDIVTVAWDIDHCVGLSIIRFDGGDVGVDQLTWVHPMVRHCGIGALMKAHSLRRALSIGVTGIWANADPVSRRFYRDLGLQPIRNLPSRTSRSRPVSRLQDVTGSSTRGDHRSRKDTHMSVEENKAIVGRWFTEFWGNPWNPDVIDELAHPEIRFHYSLHEPMTGRDEIREFATRFRTAFPDLNFWGTADLIAEGDYVVGQWEGGGTHTGPIVFDDLPIGSVPAASGKMLRFTGITVLKIEDGLIVEELGLDDGVKVLQQLGIIPSA